MTPAISDISNHQRKTSGTDPVDVTQLKPKVSIDVNSKNVIAAAADDQPSTSTVDKSMTCENDSETIGPMKNSKSRFGPPLPSFGLEPYSDDDDDDESSSDEYGGDENDEGDDDDDDNSSSDKEENIMERQKKNMQKNLEKQIMLGLRAPEQELPDEDPSALTPQQLSPKPPRGPQGMTFRTPYNNQCRGNNSQSLISKAVGKAAEEGEIALVQQLEQDYPYRQSQIRQLWSLLSPALPNQKGPAGTKHVPAPIFVTGPEGTGKSTIVRDLVNGLKLCRNNNSHKGVSSRVGCAYVNCATLDSTASTIDEVLHDAHRQLARDMRGHRHHHHHETPRKRKRDKIIKQSKKPEMESFLARTAKETARNNAKKQRVQVTDEDAKDATPVETDAAIVGENTTKEDKDTATPTAEKVDEATEDRTPENQLRRSTRVRQLENDLGNNNNDNKPTRDSIVKAVAKEASLDLIATGSPTVNLQEGAASNAVSKTSQVAAATFGQELKESLFKRDGDCAFLILDQAERLLSLAASSSTSRGNFLSQLLLLPQTKGLNLTIIVISKSTVLDHSRFNNSVSTVSSAIQPLKVHFHAYKGKEAFRQILSQPTLLKRIIGPSMLSSYVSGKDSFSRMVVRSFLNVLVQSLYGSIRDVKEMTRLGRALWPLYTRPVHSSNIEQLKKSVCKTTTKEFSTVSNGKEIVAFLDKQILPHVRQTLERSMYTFNVETELVSSRTSSVNQTPQNRLQGMSHLTKCLMLAAFICQTNRADKDKQLFTMQKNGKKNNGNKRKNEGEDLAFGATKSGVSKGYRRRMFPMERMLSVFVSIVGLNTGQQPPKGGLLGDNEINPGCIGSADFFESLSHLCDAGVLHDRANIASVSSAETANLGAPKFWCSLTRDEADVVARSLNFPLQSFLM